MLITVSALGIYALALFPGVPDVMNFRFIGTVIPVFLVFTITLFPAYCLPGWYGCLISLTLTLLLFAVPLSGLWQSGDSNAYVVGGLLQWTDARGYHWEAQQLLEGYQFSPFASRRPMFASLLAGLLWLSERNLQTTLAVLVATNGIASFFFTREVQRKWGILPGVFSLSILFLFYRRFIGTTMTENLGLALGCLAMAALLRGIYFRQNWLVYLGFFLLSSALNARAGAFFMLPTLVLWGMVTYRKQSRQFLICSASAILLAFLCNFILLKVVGTSGEVGFSNFSYVLYGIIHQGNWMTVYQDHPELRTLTEAAASQRTYELAMEAFWNNPAALITGALRAWKHFLFDHYIFSFVHHLGVKIILEILSLIGLIICCFRFRRKHNLLILFCWLGILVSVPFLPPFDADFMRAYAASIPVVTILPALGLQTVISFISVGRLKRLNARLPKPSKLLYKIYTRYFLGFVIAVLALVFLLPIFLNLVSQPVAFPPLACSADSRDFYFRPELGSIIKITSEDTLATDSSVVRLPQISIKAFQDGLEDFPHPEVKTTLSNLELPATIIQSMAVPGTTPDNQSPIETSTSTWLIIGEDFTPDYGQYYSACAMPIVAEHHLYRVEAFTKATPTKR